MGTINGNELGVLSEGRMIKRRTLWIIRIIVVLLGIAQVLTPPALVEGAAGYGGYVFGTLIVIYAIYWVLLRLFSSKVQDEDG